MALKEQLNQDLREALRAGDESRKTAIRMTLAAVRNAEIDAGHDLDDDGIRAVLNSQAKQRRESIEEFTKGRRQDLVEKEQAELKVILSYLPPQLTRDEIEAAARAVIQETGARGPADKGRVMPRLMADLRGRADGREVNEVVTDLLSRA